MNTYQVYIPIQDYLGDDVFEQELFFSGESSPTKEKVLETLETLHKRDSQYPEYIGA